MYTVEQETRQFQARLGCQQLPRKLIPKWTKFVFLQSPHPPPSSPFPSLPLPLPPSAPLSLLLSDLSMQLGLKLLTARLPSGAFNSPLLGQGRLTPHTWVRALTLTWAMGVPLHTSGSGVNNFSHLEWALTHTWAIGVFSYYTWARCINAHLGPGKLTLI